MAYQAGTAVDRFDLINKLRVFAEALGWVTDDLRAAAEGVDGYWYCHNAAGTGYWSFAMRTFTAFTVAGLQQCLDITNNTGYTPGADSINQPGGGDYSARTNLYEEPYAGYDFFGTADYLHVVVQTSAGRFRHFGIGSIDNKTAYSGGQYAYGHAKAQQTSAPPSRDLANGIYSRVFGSKGGNPGISGSNLGYLRTSHLRLDGRVHHFSGTQGSTLPPTGNRASGPGGGHRETTEANPDAGLVALSRTNFAQLVNLVPFNLYVEFPDAGWRLAGNVLDMAVCRMTSIGAKDILNIAGEDWMIIPAEQYQPTNASQAPVGQETSWDVGYAYRMEV